MTPEEQARVVTELMEARGNALEMICFHSRETLRYRLHYKNLGEAMHTVLTSREKKTLTGKKPSDRIIRK